MSLFKKKPKKDPVKMVADLDKILVSPVSFRFGGKIHEVQPISAERFYLVAAGVSELWGLAENDKPYDSNDLIDRYFKIINPVCKTISRKDVEGMGIAQITALYQLIVETVTGKSQVAQDEKKKTSHRTSLI